MTRHRAGSDDDPSDRFRVGPWLVEPGLNQLTGPGGTRHVEPRVMDLLVYLARHTGQTVSREQIVADVWKGASVIDAVLSRAVSALRIALGDDAQAPRYVQTVPRRGYRLIAEVAPAWVPAGPAPATWNAPDRPPPRAPAPAARTPTTRALAHRPFVLVSAAIILLLVAAAMVERFSARSPSDRPVGAVRDVRSIAVLPLDDLSEPPERVYFAEGMTDALTSGLARIRALRVVAPPSARRQAGLEPTVAGINLDVDAVLRGSVVQHGGEVALTLQLIATDDGTLLWAASFRRPMRDVLALQAEITRQVIQEINLEVSATDEQRFGRPAAIDPEAFERTLEARYYWSRRSRKSLERSRELFDQALLVDHRYAPAWAGLADAYVQLVNYRVLAPLLASAAARAAAERAVALDPELPEAHTALGLVELHEAWDFAAAEASYRRAIALGPAYANVHQFYAELLSFTGRHDDALREIERAHRVDPFSPIIQAVRGVVLYEAGRYEEAVDRLREALALEPTMRWTHRQCAYALERLGRLDEAAEERIVLIRAEGREEARLRAKIAVEGLVGFYRWQLDHLGPADQSAQSVSLIAEYYAGVGNHEQALAWIDRAFEEKGEWWLHLYRSPAFDPLRPRFRDRLIAAGIDASLPPTVSESSPIR